jgi:hypothetical protein
MVQSHTSAAIVIVHQFIKELLEEVCPDTCVRQELWETLLLDKLQEAYTKAMDHANFLLKIERQGILTTCNHYFNSNLQNARGERVIAALKRSGTYQRLSLEEQDGWVFTDAQMSNLSIDRSNIDQVREDIHDILKSYYKVSRKRFVDVVCQQVIYHFLLNSERSPLKLFSTDLVLSLSDDQLNAIASEDLGTKFERERLTQEVARLEMAVKVLRG